MPFVLVVLFTIALVVTITGLFLSPKKTTSRRQNEYLVTPKGRRIVDANPVPLRSGRRVVSRTSSAFIGAPSLESGRFGAGVLNPALWERMTERLGTWRFVVLLVVLFLFLSFFSLNIAFPHSAIWSPSLFGLGSNTNQSTPTTHQSAPINYTASTQLVRLGQLDPSQYQSNSEFNTWAYSACSSAAMTEVINSYGHKYRITDILQVESRIHEITPQEGLLEEVGIQRTATLFHFNTKWGHDLSLNQIIAAANSGTPVIVSFPPQLYAGGHLLVVRGGNSTYVDLADSSLYNRTQLTHAAFMKWWGGFSAVLTPA